MLDEIALLAASLHLRQSPAATLGVRDAEERMFKWLTNAHGKGVEEAIAHAMAVGALAGDPAQLAGIKTATTRALGPNVAAKAYPAIVGATSNAYYSARAGSQLASVVDMSMTDRRAIKWLAGDSMYWIGNAPHTMPGPHGMTVGEFIADTVKNGLSDGLSTTEMGATLKGAMKGHKTASDAYWRGVSANAATRASSMGALASFQAAGVVRYEWLSVMDERTSPVCRELNGQTFEVEHLIDVRNRLMAAGDPESAKDAWPWVDVNSVITAKDASSPEEALAQIGVSAPPIHFHCRSVVVVGDFGPFEVGEPAPNPPPAQPTPTPPIPPSGPEGLKIALGDKLDYAERDLWPRINGFSGRQGGPGKPWHGVHFKADGTALPWQVTGGPKSGQHLSIWPTSAPSVSQQKGAWRWLPEHTADTTGGRWVDMKALKRALEGTGIEHSHIARNMLDRKLFDYYRKSWSVPKTPPPPALAVTKLKPSVAKPRLKPRPVVAVDSPKGTWMGTLEETVSTKASGSTQQAYFKRVAHRFNELIDEELAAGIATREQAALRVYARFLKSSGGTMSDGQKKNISKLFANVNDRNRKGIDSLTKDLSALFSRDGMKQQGLGGRFVRGIRTEEHLDRASFHAPSVKIKCQWASAGGTNARATRVHEFLHYTEDYGRVTGGAKIKGETPTVVGQTFSQMLHRKGKGHRVRSLKDIQGGNYKSWEVAYDGGEFINRYAAKVYSDTTNGTEMFTVGSEYFAGSLTSTTRGKKMLQLLDKDPEHFGSMVSTFMGRVRP